MSATNTPRPPRNGVNVPAVFATLDAVKAQPELASFQFRASNRWISGTHSRSTFDRYRGAGGEQRHTETFQCDGDHPPVLVGDDKGPTPVEFVLHALATCLTAGVVNIASAKGITLTEVESTVEGDIDLLGVFGIDTSVRNGYQGIRASFRIKGDATEEELRGLVARSQARSAVYDVLTNPVPIQIEATAERQTQAA